MIKRSISSFVEKKQESLNWKFELERFYAGNIFCPMCDIEHENNTFCQMNMES